MSVTFSDEGRAGSPGSFILSCPSWYSDHLVILPAEELFSDHVDLYEGAEKSVVVCRAASAPGSAGVRAAVNLTYSTSLGSEFIKDGECLTLRTAKMAVFAAKAIQDVKTGITLHLCTLGELVR